jgi:hypothetical protein
VGTLLPVSAFRDITDSHTPSLRGDARAKSEASEASLLALSERNQTKEPVIRSLSCLVVRLMLVFITLAPAFVSASSPPPVKFIVPPTITTSITPYVLSAADLNGDGNMDLILATWEGVAVLLGKGDGTFPNRHAYVLHQGARAIAVADMNNDHIPDLVVLTGSSIQIFLGNGDGTFKPPKETAGGSDALTIADFNGDGNLDVAVLLDDGFAVYLGDGDGTLQPATRNRFVAHTVSIASADFKGDGKADLAITATGTDAPNGIGVFFGNGDGSFQQADTYADVEPGQLCVADMNSDGFPDLVTLDTSGFSVLLNNGKGKFSFKHSSSAGFTGLFAIGDFNNDGKPDIVIEGLGIFLGNGDGTVQAPTKTYADQTPRNLVVADVNNDHKLDVVQVYYFPSGGGIQIFYGGGNGGLVGPRTFQNDAGALIVTGDFNNDGKIDVASVGYQNNDAVTVILGNGDGTFQLPLPGNPTSGGLGCYCNRGLQSGWQARRGCIRRHGIRQRHHEHTSWQWRRHFSASQDHRRG